MMLFGWQQVSTKQLSPAWIRDGFLELKWTTADSEMKHAIVFCISSVVLQTQQMILWMTGAPDPHHVLLNFCGHHEFIKVVAIYLCARMLFLPLLDFLTSRLTVSPDSSHSNTLPHPGHHVPVMPMKVTEDTSAVDSIIGKATSSIADSRM